jgi:hypothetical protein
MGVWVDLMTPTLRGSPGQNPGRTPRHRKLFRIARPGPRVSEIAAQGRGRPGVPGFCPGASPHISCRDTLTGTSPHFVATPRSRAGEALDPLAVVVVRPWHAREQGRLVGPDRGSPCQVPSAALRVPPGRPCGPHWTCRPRPDMGSLRVEHTPLDPANQPGPHPDRSTPP